MADFTSRAPAYTTAKPQREFRGRKTAALAPTLIEALQRRPFLLVLDGLERVLVAYHRLDAAQARDDQVESDVDHRACIKPEDSDLRCRLVTAAPTKILVTSRLMPTALAGKSVRPLPAVRPHLLAGLHADDALALMRGQGVRGDGHVIQQYLRENLGNHPLLVGVVAGLVNDYVPDPGNFKRWADDPQGGASLELSKLDMSQRRTHILAGALAGLPKGSRQLLSRIAALADAVAFDTVVALNPFLPAPPKATSRRRLSAEEMNAHRQSEAYRGALPRLVSALQDLQRRGLLQWDRQENSYDLHPVVRGYSFDSLEDEERTDICNRVVDYFQSRPPRRLRGGDNAR